MMNTRAIDALIDAKFEYERARELLYFGDERPVDRVYEAVNLDRFERIRKTLGKAQATPVRIGKVINRSFEYRGCVFLCTQIGDDDGRA